MALALASADIRPQTSSRIDPRGSSKSKAQSTADRVVGHDRSNSNTASPLSSLTIASPSIRQDRGGRVATDATIKGKGLPKSCPLRV